MSSERSDLRDVKGELVRVITVEQKKRGMTLPRPDLATAYIEEHKIIEKTEAHVPENKARHDAPTVNEHTPDIERIHLETDEALARVRAKYGKAALERIWLRSVRMRDPQFAADFDAICAAHIVMDAENKVSFFTPLGRMKLHALLTSAIAKYGDPNAPAPKRIQVG